MCGEQGFNALPEGAVLSAEDLEDGLSLGGRLFDGQREQGRLTLLW